MLKFTNQAEASWGGQHHGRVPTPVSSAKMNCIPPPPPRACTFIGRRPPNSFSLLEYYLIATSSSYQDILFSVHLSSSIIIRQIFPFTPILVYRADFFFFLNRHCETESFWRWLGKGWKDSISKCILFRREATWPLLPSLLPFFPPSISIITMCILQ